MQAIPPPPGAPDEETAARWKSQATMLILLTEDYGDDPNDVVNGWMQQHLGVAADMVGPPDVSANTLLDAATQLSTPGLYGLGAPSVEHLDLTTSGLLAWASEGGYWTKMQVVQKNVFGVGNWVLALDVDDGQLVGQLVACLIQKHDCTTNPCITCATGLNVPRTIILVCHRLELPRHKVFGHLIQFVRR